MKRFGDGRDWFFEKRYGLFIHWGIYAVAGWHEQHHFRLNIPREEYVAYAQQFNPVKYDPHAWLDLMEEAGMEYIVFTTKHIDGFCMWDTEYTDYNIMNTPYGQDVLRMLADACHERGVPLGLYYSVPDMHQTNYPYFGGPYELPEQQPGDEPDKEKYFEHVRNQVRELCTKYGEIHAFWWDANRHGFQDPSMQAMIRELQPKAVINGRGFGEGDFRNPERDWDSSVHEKLYFEEPVEACQSVGFESWGYKEDEDFYSDRHLISSIDTVLAKGGNYLLNAGPTAEGTIPPESAAILRRIGAWLRLAREGLYDVEPVTHLIEDRSVLLTRRDNSLYVHMNQPPRVNRVLLKPFNVQPERAVLLNTGQVLETRVDLTPWQHREGLEYLRVRNIPVNDLASSVPVIRLDFEDLDDAIRRAGAGAAGAEEDPDVKQELE